MGRKRIPTSPASPFYGYPAELIAEWCGVSVGTAEHWKAGRRRPSLSALRLFRLYRDGKVLDDAWSEYKVVDRKLFGPDVRPFKPSHLALYSLVWHALSEKDPDSYISLLEKRR